MLRRPILVASALAALLAASATLLPASASTVEDLTTGFVSYQYDGGTHHDAPDGCAEADAAWSLPIGSATDGILVPPDDVRDAFVFDVPRSLVGERLELAIEEPTDPADLQGLAIDAFVPGCMGSILDAINWPHPEPSPPAPAAGERQVSPDLTPRYCNPQHRVFLLDSMTGFTPPASIHVAWTDGTEQPVPLRWTNERHAVYVTQDNLDITLKGAWANIAAAWSGNFTLFLGPCDAQDGGAVYGEAPAVELGSLAFTPVRAGPHVVVISWMGGSLRSIQPPTSVDPEPLLPLDPHDAMHDPAGAAEALLADATTPPSASSLPGLVGPRSCHFCVAGLEDLVRGVSYSLAIRAA